MIGDFYHPNKTNQQQQQQKISCNEQIINEPVMNLLTKQLDIVTPFIYIWYWMRVGAFNPN